MWNNQNSLLETNMVLNKTLDPKKKFNITEEEYIIDDKTNKTDNVHQSQKNLNMMNINNFQNMIQNNNVNNINNNNNNNINNNCNNNFMNNTPIIDPMSQYDFLCFLGKGNFGSVRKVRDKNTGQIYALKEINILKGKSKIQQNKKENHKYLLDLIILILSNIINHLNIMRNTIFN